MRGDRYQISLIGLGVVATALFGLFFYRELFPEYKIYQNTYVKLEEFRSTYTGQPVPAFKHGVKQIVIEAPNKGPPEIDRCTSCHVTLQFQHFSPTQLTKDVNGNIVLDENGVPKKEPNPSYVWGKLEEKIADLINAETNANLTPSEVKRRLEEAEELKALQVAHVGEKEYSMPKVLQMHPLIGRETRPFEFHPVDDYGCTSCHSGNGRGLTTEKAHGPVFDGAYEIEDIGPVPKFTEADPDNDPTFARVFNHKPGHELLFQTTPILVGGLIEAKCMQCHQSSKELLQSSTDKAKTAVQKLQKKALTIQESYSYDLDSLASLVQLRINVSNQGVKATVEQLKARSEDFQLPAASRNQALKQMIMLEAMVGGADGLRPQNEQAAKDVALQKINQLMSASLGSSALTTSLNQVVDKEGVDIAQIVRQFVEENRTKPDASGELFSKANAIEANQQLFQHIDDTQNAFNDAIQDTNQIGKTDVDLLTSHYAEGQRLFISQACYPCHRIAGFSRGGVGMDLTQIGKSYPWYIKESIVWPQADLKTSTMPNFHLDHKELEDLMAFLLAQKGQTKAISEANYKMSIAEWEAGKKQPWEKPVSPADMHDLHYSMTVFATEGCAACHRLKGFKSNVGFKQEKEKADFSALYKEKEWFHRTIPEEISGSDLVKAIEKNQAEIDARIVSDVRENSLIEEIDAKYPGNTASFYSNFAYASRAKDKQYKNTAELSQWKERVHRVLMMYVQEYGLGRVVGPRPNWSGVYRNDEWLMEHFRKPNSTVVRSIMPAFPFDETKFYALTHMLNVLGAQNRDENHQLWDFRGFNPEVAYEMYCAQCHGNQRVGNGPVSEWIYPVPKNLRNADFMQNLTRERAKDSIHHGVKGGPMPPWGEAPDKPTTKGIPVLNEAQIDQLVDWLYSSLPGGSLYKSEKNTLKWQYEPENVLEELKKEGSKLKKTEKSSELSFLPKGEGYFAALEPKVSSEVGEIFDIQQSPAGSPDAHLYYINKRYYTPENIEAGRTYFELNCAVCHGREGDGTGIRAGVMLDAKPRMLTNLNWIDTRDDMRLLRSIKYGVPGTSMQPWGDQTTTLQRLQLVMFIRNLSQEQELRDKLYKALYQSFDEARITVDNARIAASPELVQLNNTLRDAKAEQQNLAAKVRAGKSSSEAAAAAYKQQLDLANQLKKKEQNDNEFQSLKTAINAEKMIYEEIGLALIANDDQQFSKLVEMIKLHGNRFAIKDGKLTYTLDDTSKLNELKKGIVEGLTVKIESLEKQIEKVQGRIPSPERAQELHELNVEKETLKNIKFKTLAGFEESKRLQNQQSQMTTQLYGTTHENGI